MRLSWFMKNGLFWFCLALAAIAHGQAQAATQIVVPVENESAEARQAGISVALSKLLVRLTGDPAIVDAPETQTLFEEATRFVQLYSYEALPADAAVSAAEDEAEAKTASAGKLLRVTLAEEAIARELALRQVPLWVPDMPPVLAWIAVDAGGERYLLSGQRPDEGVARALVGAAGALGVTLRLPDMDEADRRDVAFADVWGGFREALTPSLNRYNTEILLIGRMLRRDGDNWQVRWLGHWPNHNEVWTSSGEGLYATSQALASEMAWSLRRSYARVPALGTADVLMIDVYGVRTAAEFARLNKALAGLSGVRDVQLAAMSPERMTFRLALSGDRSRTQRHLDAANEWRGYAGDDARPGVPSYQLMP